MKRHVVAAAVGMLALLASCGGPRQGSAPETDTPTTSAKLSAPGAPPEPDQATAAAYVADLEAIDPDIVHGKPDKAIDRGRNQCSSIAQSPTDQAELVDLVQKRFTSPDHPEGFGPQKSEQILAVVRKYLCP